MRRLRVMLGGEIPQKLSNIPFATTTTGKRARPSGNGIDIHLLLEQAFNHASPGAAAMAHDFIGRIGMFRIHGRYFTDFVGSSVGRVSVA